MDQHLDALKKVLQDLFPPPWVEIIIRKNNAASTHAIHFHLDHAKETCQIFLNDSQEYEGGRTFYSTGSDGVYIPERLLGSALVHDNTVWHAVSHITKGVRYGLFLLKHAQVL